MSSPTLPVILSSRANEDFADILLYSLRTWGEEHAAAYETAIVEQHVIYYHLDETADTVMGILHAKMNPQLHLDL